MLDIGASELLIIAVVAIVVIAPKDLPAFLRMVGGYVGKVRRMALDFQLQLNDAIRDDEIERLRQQVTELGRGVETDMGRGLAPDRYTPRRPAAALPAPTGPDAPLDAATGHPRMTPLAPPQGLTTVPAEAPLAPAAEAPTTTGANP